MMPAKWFANGGQPHRGGAKDLLALAAPAAGWQACHFYITYFMVHIQPIP
jgi:hypothetical protein